MWNTLVTLEEGGRLIKIRSVILLSIARLTSHPLISGEKVGDFGL